jgi:hypothetical protein
MRVLPLSSVGRGELAVVVSDDMAIEFAVWRKVVKSVLGEKAFVVLERAVTKELRVRV